MNRNVHAGTWLLCDMCLHIATLSIVKAMGPHYPAVQLVFLRTIVGLAMLLPWFFRSRQTFSTITAWQRHIARIICSAMALTCGYYAVSRIPLALFTTVNYLRPAILMLLAVIVLGEKINRWRWMAVVLGFLGVSIAVYPVDYVANTGLLALLIAALTGSSATILLRQLKGNSEIVMMVFYTAGIAIITSPLAFLQRVPIANKDIAALLAIGVFAQIAQYCFLRAHWLGDTGFLGPLTYVSRLLSAVSGYLFFEEQPTLSLIAGASIVVCSALLLGHRSTLST